MINRTGKALKRHPQPDARPGTYALLLRIAADEVALIGRRGRLPLPLAPGWAIYAGSAFGPGGESYLRLCFARGHEGLAEATGRLVDWLARRG